MKSRVMFVWRCIRRTSLTSVPAWQKWLVPPFPTQDPPTPVVHYCHIAHSKLWQLFKKNNWPKLPGGMILLVPGRKSPPHLPADGVIYAPDSYPPSVTTQIWKLPSYAVWKPRNYRLKRWCFTNHLSICSGCLLVSSTNGAWQDASLHSKYPCNSSLCDGVFVNHHVLKQKRYTSEMCFWSAWIAECTVRCSLMVSNYVALV